MHLTNDSPSFTPVHSQIRAIGPQDLHLWKGRGHESSSFTPVQRQIKVSDLSIYTLGRRAAVTRLVLHKQSEVERNYPTGNTRQ